jgi:hypothetical protein
MVKSPTSAYYSPETRIILITPPPVNTKQWNRPDSPRVFETTRSYAAAVKEVGEKENVPVADVWTKIFDAAGRSEEACEKYLSDGLHLTSDGYNVCANLNSNLSGLLTFEIKDRLPGHHGHCGARVSRIRSYLGSTWEDATCVCSVRPLLNLLLLQDIDVFLCSWDQVNVQNPRPSLMKRKAQL